MDETIGVKGGKNDRRRSLKIKESRKKRLQEETEDKEIKELEKKVRKKQIYTLVRALPIAIGGGIIKTIHDTAIGKKEHDKEEENSKWRIKEYDADISPKTPQEAKIEEIKKQRRKRIITTPTGEKIIIVVNNNFFEEKEEENEATKPKQKETKKDSEVIINVEEKNKEKPTVKPEKIEPEIKQKKGIAPEYFGDTQEYQDIIDEEEIDFDNLDEETRKKLDNIKSRRIVAEYEKQLKDIRYELRNIIFEYNVLANKEETIVLKKDAEIILDNLTYVIEKIEKLKSRIKIDDLDKYDDNYIYYLIEGYLEEFNNNNVISEIKDSPLYIMISEKLEELDNKKNNLRNKVNKKKDKLADKEERFEELKNNYYTVERMNKKLIEFQEEQERLLEDIKYKVANAKTETQKVEYEFEGLNQQSRRMFRMLSFQMFLPFPRFAKSLAATAAAYMYFVNNVINPHIVEKEYKIITVKDYSYEIKNSIAEIDDAINSLGKTSAQIDKIINEIKTKYKDYFGVVKECDNMISNLYKMRSNIKEKEYEMEKIKEQQEKELELNNSKVLSRGKFPVNKSKDM